MAQANSDEANAMSNLMHFAAPRNSYDAMMQMMSQRGMMNMMMHPPYSGPGRGDGISYPGMPGELDPMQYSMMMSQMGMSPPPFMTAGPVHAALAPEETGPAGEPSSFPRLALPKNLVEEQPTYVNAKQYFRILKRREARAKLETQRKIVSKKNVYMHKSRHNHAMRRVRGANGKFLNKAELEELRLATASQAVAVDPAAHAEGEKS